MEFIQENWVSIVAALTGLMWVARLVVKITPTPKDDKVWAKVVKVLKGVGLVIPDNLEDIPTKKDEEKQ